MPHRVEGLALHLEGLQFSLPVTSDPATLHASFDALAREGSAVDPLQRRPWGDHDGPATDRYGIRWLIGYQG